MRPYSLQPFKILPFLGKEYRKWPTKLSTEMFLSFEDALWNLLPRLGYPKGSKILVPSYYCVDVVNNMIAHGYNVAYYPLKNDLTYDLGEILKVVEEEECNIFVEFQVNGVRNNLLKDIERKLHPRIFIISDRVHSVMTATEEFIPHNDRHMFLNSYRKVTPFPGSLAVFSRSIRKESVKQRYPWGYLVKAFALWGFHVLLLRISYIFSSQSAMDKALKILTIHDNLIGDSVQSASLPRWTKFFYEFIDQEKVSYAKRERIFIYESVLGDFLRKSPRFQLPANLSDSYDMLRGYPIITSYEDGLRLTKKLQKNKLSIIAQSPNSPWSAHQSLFLFPLSPSFTKKDVKDIAQRLLKSLTSVQ